MAMKLQSKVTCSLDLFKLQDLTGTYDSLSNLGGYGAPNVDPEDVVSADVIITTPSGDVVQLSIYNGVPPVSSIPSSLDSYYFPITPNLLGLEEFDMGFYGFEYKIIYSDGGTEVESVSKTCFFYCAPVACCIAKKENGIDLCSNPQEIEEAMLLRGLFVGMQAQARVGNKKEALAILQYLKTKCDCCC